MKLTVELIGFEPVTAEEDILSILGMGFYFNAKLSEKNGLYDLAKKERFNAARIFFALDHPGYFAD